MRIALAILCALLAGCATTSKIRTKLGEVIAPKDAGKPATLDTATTGDSVQLPKGSRLTVTKVAAIPFTPATVNAPQQAAQPAKEVVQVELAADSTWTRQAETVQAQTGTVDTTIATHKIDVAERRWLLWAAIGCGIGGVVLRSMMPAWPGLSNGLLLGAALAFASWKFSELPAWIWATGIVVVGLIALGYKRAEWDKDGDGIPDVLEGRK